MPYASHRSTEQRLLFSAVDSKVQRRRLKRRLRGLWKDGVFVERRKKGLEREKVDCARSNRMKQVQIGSTWMVVNVAWVTEINGEET